MRIRRHLTDDVRVVMTPTAQRIVSEKTMDTYCHYPVHNSPWTGFDVGRPIHRSLTKRAEEALVLPATPHTIAKAGSGISDNLVLDLLLAAGPASTAIAPVANDRTWRSPAMHRGRAILTAHGFTFIETTPSPEVGLPAGPSSQVRATTSAMPTEGIRSGAR